MLAGERRDCFQSRESAVLGTPWLTSMMVRSVVSRGEESHSYTPGGNFLLSVRVKQAEGTAAHLHQVQPPPVFVSASQLAWSVCAVWQGSCATTVVTRRRVRIAIMFEGERVAIMFRVG